MVAVGITIILLTFVFVLFYFLKRYNGKRRLIEESIQMIKMHLNQVSDEDIEAEEKKIKQAEIVFTERQVEIINLVRQGKTNKEIGAELFISENTVKYHLKIIYNVLGIENRWDLKP